MKYTAWVLTISKAAFPPAQRSAAQGKTCPMLIYKINHTYIWHKQHMSFMSRFLLHVLVMSTRLKESWTEHLVCWKIKTYSPIAAEMSKSLQQRFSSAVRSVWEASEGSQPCQCTTDSHWLNVGTKQWWAAGLIPNFWHQFEKIHTNLDLPSKTNWKVQLMFDNGTLSVIFIEWWVLYIDWVNKVDLSLTILDLITNSAAFIFANLFSLLPY